MYFYKYKILLHYACIILAGDTCANDSFDRMIQT